MNIIKILTLNNLSRYKLILIAVFITAVIISACNNKITDPPPDEEPLPKLTIINEDVSCTEVWLKLKVDSLSSPAEIKLYRDSTLILNLDLSLSASGGLNLDTLYYEENLSPNQSYNYKLTVNYKGEEYSDSLTVRTLDTTSSNFTWQTFEFGEHGNSIIWDVAIISPENIWCVGAIYMKDSLGNNDHQAYNAIHWDGEKWELKRIMFYTICGQENRTPYPATSIFVFNENEIWISGGGRQLARISGTEQVETMCLPFSMVINKLWGTSSENLYAVGNGGNIAYYNGSSWRKMESGTNVDLLDIWGTKDGKTIWACGYTSDYSTTVLLRYDGNVWNKVYEGSGNNQNNNEYIGPTSSVWTNSKYFTYVASWGKLYRQQNNNILNINRVTPNFSDVAFAMHGTNHNNIFIAGQDGLTGHYNGVTYTEFHELKESAKNYLAVAVKDNITVVVGNKYGGLSAKAVIAIGRRN